MLWLAISLAILVSIFVDPALARVLRVDDSKEFASGKLPLEDVAIGLISGRQHYWDSLHKSVLQYTPKGVLLEAPGKCDCGFVAGFKALSVAEPSAKWYYVGDEDAFLYLNFLTRLLARYDSAKPIVMATLGNHPGSYEIVCNGQKSPIPDTHVPGTEGHVTFFGGTGIIVSEAMMRQINWDQQCHHNAMAADRDVTCLIGQSWQPDFQFVKLKGLKNEEEMDPSFGTFLQIDSDLLAASEYGVIHHLSPGNITKKAYLNSNLQGSFSFKKVPLWNNHGCADVNSPVEGVRSHDVLWEGREHSIGFDAGKLGMMFTEKGVVTTVFPGQRAHRAGVKAGWVAQHIDGQPWTRALNEEKSQTSRTISFLTTA